MMSSTLLHLISLVPHPCVKCIHFYLAKNRMIIHFRAVLFLVVAHQFSWFFYVYDVSRWFTHSDFNDATAQMQHYTLLGANGIYHVYFFHFILLRGGHYWI